LAEELGRINFEIEQIANTQESKEAARRQIEQRVHEGGLMPRIKRMLRLLHQSRVKVKPGSAAQRVLDLAIEEAELLGHEKVGTGHLLAGSLRDESGDAAKVLIESGATLETVRAGVRRLPEPDQHLFDDEEISERFTDRMKKVLRFAEEAAQQLHLEYIDTEHLLLGLLKEGRGVGANVLKGLGVDLDKARAAVGKLTTAGPEPVSSVFLRTRRAARVLAYAVEEARQMNHNYVGTEHLLLGMLREVDGVAAHVLVNLGLNLDAVRKEVLLLWGTSGD
jgi:ATP-dependent Clp protease ATP-binding subunit ClpA